MICCVFHTWAVDVGAFPGQAGAQQQGALGRGLVVCEHQVQPRAVVQPVGREEGQLAHGLRTHTHLCSLNMSCRACTNKFGLQKA